MELPVRFQEAAAWTNNTMPIMAIKEPEIKPSQGKRVSGWMKLLAYCRASMMSSPSRKTPIVWVMVTVRPRKTACLGVPFVPTR